MYVPREMTRFCKATGDLHIDFRPCGLDIHLKYTRWSEGMAVYRRQDSEWVLDPYDLEIPLVIEEHLNNPGLPVHAFVTAIPQKILEKVLRFQYLQTTLLQLFALSAKALETFDAAPILLWLAADATKSDSDRHAVMDSLLDQKMTDILDRLFGNAPFRKSHVRFLRKLRAHHGTQDELETAKRHVLSPSRVEAFRHWRTIPIPVLRALERYPALADSNLMKAVPLEACDSTESLLVLVHQAASIWHDSLQLADVLRIAHSDQILASCTTKAQLQMAHDRWQNRLNRLDPGYRLRPCRTEAMEPFIDPDTPFPYPPIPGEEHIRPITCESDLWEEGVTMDHCVGGYANAVRRGECFLYSVHYPERATLEIRRQGARIGIGQFRLSGNRMPSDESWNRVREWVNRHASPGPVT